MAKKEKAPAGTKGKAKAAAKEETKKEKVVKQAKKGKHHTSHISLSFLWIFASSDMWSSV